MRAREVEVLVPSYFTGRPRFSTLDVPDALTLFEDRGTDFSEQESQMYLRWMADNMWTFVPAQQYVAEFLSTFQDFPPVRGSSLNVDNVLQELLQQGTGR